MKKLLVLLLFYSCENTITNNSDSATYEVIINEINYNSLNDLMEDWVELHNPTSEAIFIGRWELKDDDDNVFTLPENTVLLSGHYLVLCRNSVSFYQEFPSVSNVVGDFEFGLSSDGEDIVSLFHSNGLLVDEVKYGVTTPWPTEPNGEGPTLELIHPSLDNASAENWAASSSNGTPGEINSVYNDE